MSDTKTSDPVRAEADIGPSPGHQFVRIKWLSPVGDEKVGSVEWAESCRAVNLALSGHVELADGVDALPQVGRDHWVQGLRELSSRAG